MNIRAGTRICSMAGRVKGTVIQVLRNGSVVAEVDHKPETVVILLPDTFQILKPRITAKDLILLREMRISL